MKVKEVLDFLESPLELEFDSMRAIDHEQGFIIENDEFTLEFSVQIITGSESFGSHEIVHSHLKKFDFEYHLDITESELELLKDIFWEKVSKSVNKLIE